MPKPSGGSPGGTSGGMGAVIADKVRKFKSKKKKKESKSKAIGREFAQGIDALARIRGRAKLPK